MCPSSSQPLPSLSHPNPVSSSFCISIHSHSKSPTLTHKHPQNHIFKNTPPKTTTNNPTYPPNPPTNFYLPSLSIIYTSSSNPTYHLSSHTILSIFPLPLETTSESYSGMLMEFAGLSMGMGFPWDGTAHICICHGRVAMS